MFFIKKEKKEVTDIIVLLQVRCQVQRAAAAHARGRRVQLQTAAPLQAGTGTNREQN